MIITQHSSSWLESFKGNWKGEISGCFAVELILRKQQSMYRSTTVVFSFFSSLLATGGLPPSFNSGLNYKSTLGIPPEVHLKMWCLGRMKRSISISSRLPRPDILSAGWIFPLWLGLWNCGPAGAGGSIPTVDIWGWLWWGVGISAPRWPWRTAPLPLAPLGGRDLCWSGKTDNPAKLWNQKGAGKSVVDL